jgi:hypothetical protein
MYNNSEHHVGTLSWLSGRKGATKNKKKRFQVHTRRVSQKIKIKPSCPSLHTFVDNVVIIAACAEGRKKEKKSEGYVNLSYRIVSPVFNLRI